MHAFPEYYRVGWNCLVLLSLLVEQLNVINPPGPQFVSLTFVTVTGLSFLIALKGGGEAGEGGGGASNYKPARGKRLHLRLNI